MDSSPRTSVKSKICCTLHDWCSFAHLGTRANGTWTYGSHGHMCCSGVLPALRSAWNIGHMGNEIQTFPGFFLFTWRSVEAQVLVRVGHYVMPPRSQKPKLSQRWVYTAVNSTMQGWNLCYSLCKAEAPKFTSAALKVNRKGLVVWTRCLENRPYAAKFDLNS